MPRWASPASSAGRSDLTRPTSSTSPVNMALLPARRVERDGHVLPDLLDLGDPEPQGLSHPGGAQRPDHGHPLRPDEPWRVEQRQLVRDAPLPPPGCGPPAPPAPPAPKPVAVSPPPSTSTPLIPRPPNSSRTNRRSILPSTVGAVTTST